ncbi:Sodium/solute symporter [Trinorchestia longiramus]|nr:Sodium/solute symporter [Trinorchestia longiramus]
MYATLVGTFIVLTIIFLSGIGIHAVYYGCDPISLGLIEKRDQITPFYVMHHLSFLTGVPGLFISCLFSGTLSSISSMLNAVPTMLWNDFIVELQYFQSVPEKTKANFNKLMSPVQLQDGVFLFCLPKPGHKFRSLSGHGQIITQNNDFPLLGFQSSQQQLNSERFTTFQNADHFPPTSHPLWFLYNISYAYHSLIGTIVCLTVAILVTFLTGCEKLENVQPEHVLSCLKRKVGSSGPNASAEQESFLDDALVSKIESKSIRRLA